MVSVTIVKKRASFVSLFYAVNVSSSRVGSIAQWLACLPMDPAALRSTPRVSKKNSEDQFVRIADF